MISSTTTGQETTEGRSVRDIVEHQHEQVNDAWCRKLVRQLLQSLERQYAMDMPHRAITADTVVFHQNGEPLLLPSIVSDPAPEEADDLTSLAKLIHYAITQELMPAGPLHGRGLDGYSEALLTAVDRCMDPDPALRPRSIAELRDILGIVAPGSSPLPPPPPMPQSLEPDPEPHPIPEPQPPAPAVPTQSLRASADSEGSAKSTNSTNSINSAPAPAAPPSQPRSDTRPPAPSRRPRWTMAAILLAILLAGYAALRISGTLDRTAPTVPQDPAGAQVQGDGSAAPAPAGTAAAPDAAAAQPGQPGQAAPSTLPQDAGTLPAPAAAVATGPAAATTATTGTTPSGPAASPPQAPGTAASTGTIVNPNAGATYRLQIQPWGTIYVDGVDRGVSPPIKRLQLPPGRHTVRVTNPNFQERVLDVDTANGDGRIVVDFSAAE
jgi:hypothetical protein